MNRQGNLYYVPEREDEMAIGGFTLKTQKANYENYCNKIHKLHVKMGELSPNSEEYLEMESEVRRIEAQKIRLAEEMKKNGFNDPTFF